MKEGLKQQKTPQKFDKYKFKENGILMHRDRFYVPNVGDITKMVMKEIHDVPYAKHSGYQKIVAIVRKPYYWIGMKNDVAKHIARFMECQKVKV